MTLTLKTFIASLRWLCSRVRKPSRAGAVRLRVSPVLAGAAAAGRLKVVGARYDLDEGAVSLLA